MDKFQASVKMRIAAGCNRNRRPTSGAAAAARPRRSLSDTGCGAQGKSAVAGATLFLSCRRFIIDAVRTLFACYRSRDGVAAKLNRRKRVVSWPAFLQRACGVH